MTKWNFSVALEDAPRSFSLALDEAPAAVDNIVRRMKIFKTGKFADSQGRVNTWTDADLQEMVQNFTNLRQRGILRDVPVRIDHSYSMKDVVGWFLSIYTDPAEPGFLFADIEFTEPDAKAQYERRTLRSRSIEIGKYETNDGEKFKNVVIGLAFVDLPAVEGLFRSAIGTTSAHSAPGDQSSGDGSATNNQGDPIVTTNKEHVPQNAGTEPLPVQPPAAGSPPANNSPTPADRPGDGNFGHPTHPLQIFRVNGAETSDYAAVQAHIAALETFRVETVQHARTSFVESLAAGPSPRITNPMKEAFSGLVITMSPEQFTAFQAGWAAAPAVPMTGQIPTGAGDQPHPAAGAMPTELETYREIVAQHRLAGMSEEEIQKKDSFKRIMALTDGKG